MTKIAYKTNTTNPNLPNGFIIDHFETDQETVEGYTITDHSAFQAMLANNVQLMRQHEINVGIQPAPHGVTTHVRRDPGEAQPVDNKVMEDRKKLMEQNRADHTEFMEFLAWKKSQRQGS